MNLRYHHLLCIRKFTGHGYDEAFTEFMMQTVEHLRLNPDTPVNLKTSCDDLCEVCPNRCGKLCKTETKVRRMDEAVKERLHGDILTWQESEADAQKIFVSQWEAVCESCTWFSLCTNTERGMIYEDKRT